MVRLLDHLQTLGLDRRAAREALATGKVHLQGVPTADGGRLVEPSAVSYNPSRPRLTPGRDAALIYQDAHLAVVWKPSGMLAVPAPRRKETNVLAFVGHLLGTVFPVHRIDEGTSGLMMVARTSSAQEHLKAQLEEHTVERRYLALARGNFPLSSRTVRSMLVRDRGDGKRGTLVVEEDDGDESFVRKGEPREAVTTLEGLEALQGATLVQATLQTGRTHQVRIHLAEQRHPILGDTLYGDPHGTRVFPRLALHAAVLGFRHPVSQKVLRFEAPLADDLEGWRRDHGRRKLE